MAQTLRGIKPRSRRLKRSILPLNYRAPTLPGIEPGFLKVSISNRVGSANSPISVCEHRELNPNQPIGNQLF